MSRLGINLIRGKKNRYLPTQYDLWQAVSIDRVVCTQWVHKSVRFVYFAFGCGYVTEYLSINGAITCYFDAHEEIVMLIKLLCRTIGSVT